MTFNHSPLLFLLYIFWMNIVQAGIFHLDPINRDQNNDGSFINPWTTLQYVFDNDMIETQSYSPLPYLSTSILQSQNQGSPIKAGDTLMLLSCYHCTILYLGM